MFLSRCFLTVEISYLLLFSINPMYIQFYKKNKKKTNVTPNLNSIELKIKNLIPEKKVHSGLRLI